MVSVGVLRTMKAAPGIPSGSTSEEWRRFTRSTSLTPSLQSDGEEPTSPVAPADEVEVPADASGTSGNMSVLDALKGTPVKDMLEH